MTQAQTLTPDAAWLTCPVDARASYTRRRAVLPRRVDVGSLVVSASGHAGAHGVQRVARRDEERATVRPAEDELCGPAGNADRLDEGAPGGRRRGRRPRPGRRCPPRRRRRPPPTLVDEEAQVREAAVVVHERRPGGHLGLARQVHPLARPRALQAERPDEVAALHAPAHGSVDEGPGRQTNVLPSGERSVRATAPSAVPRCRAAGASRPREGSP